MKRIVCLAACLAGSIVPFITVAQRSLTVDDLVNWRRITDQRLSDDGKWTAVKVEPWEGDATIRLYNAKGAEVASYDPAAKVEFASSSQYALVTRVPSKALTDSLKLRKTKEDEMPMNTLIVRQLSGREETIDSLKSYLLAERADWLGYQRGRKDSTLHIRSLDGSRTYRYPAVKEYKFARKSGILYYVSGGDTLGTKAGLYTFLPDKGVTTLVKEGSGVFKQIALNETGDRLAFLYCEQKDSVYKALDLWLSVAQQPATPIAARGHQSLPAGWVLNENGEVSFSENGRRLFFGSSPEPRQKDTTRLESDFPGVQVWSWNEPEQYTVQSFNKTNELKRTYRAVYNIEAGTLFQLAGEELPNCQVADEGNAPFALLSTSRPYSLSSMWEGRTRSDYYTVSLETGERQLIRRADYGQLRLSPRGRYAFWYADTDSSWHTLSLADLKTYRLTTPTSFPAWDEDNDVPDYPSSHGAAGWLADDTAILLYDRYDIWRFDPQAATLPVNLTRNGRTEKITYRRIRTDREERWIDLSRPQLLAGFNETTKGSGFYESTLIKAAPPKTLLAGNCLLRFGMKARNSEAVIYTSETYEQYPDVRLADLRFRQPIQLTHEGRQQEGIRWGTTELVSWTSADGIPLEGVVYKPAGFDPSRKYPMIVNFYERNAETLYSYHMPEPGRSTIDYHMYNSQGYLIFNPDVRYRDGYPGESCYNAVMPGIDLLVARGYVDEQSIGAQGHSWGGYQVAYLATRTNRFAAIESGAPVVNMFSAYGGIRWGSGLARAFQYEHTQSRLGATPWTGPERYTANSPLFAMDKVQTPILIMHNDADGHVPWYQGIEYFVALKRLGKEAWMLNYTGEPHWPMKMANRIDFQRRMLQFFNHFLQGSPMPQWMQEGVPAVKQEYELGY